MKTVWVTKIVFIHFSTGIFELVVFCFSQSKFTFPEY